MNTWFACIWATQCLICNIRSYGDTSNAWRYRFDMIVSFLAQNQYIALSIYRGHFSSYNSRKTPHSSPVKAMYGCLSWAEIWPKFYHCNCCAVCTIVWYMTAIYWEPIISHSSAPISEEKKITKLLYNLCHGIFVSYKLEEMRNWKVSEHLLICNFQRFLLLPYVLMFSVTVGVLLGSLNVCLSKSNTTRVYIDQLSEPVAKNISYRNHAGGYSLKGVP